MKLFMINLILLVASVNVQAELISIKVLGDSFASNFNNNVGPFDWPILLQQQGFGLELHAFPGQRFAVHHSPFTSTWFPTSTADKLIIAAGLNDALSDFNATAPGEMHNEPIFDQYYTPSVFSSPSSWNTQRILVERAVAQWRQNQPGKEIIIFNLPPFLQYLLDRNPSGIYSFRLNRAAAYNQWLEAYAAANSDIRMFDIHGFLQAKINAKIDYYAESGTSLPRLHPNPATQMELAGEISAFLTAVPEPSSCLLFFSAVILLVFERKARLH